MKKTVLFLLPLFLYANQPYIIEADGEFGKELKQLIEKYSKDTNSSIKIYKKEEKSRLLNIGIDKNKNYDLSVGEKLYKSKCQQCHGENGTKRAFGSSAKLSELTVEDIEQAFSGYMSDLNYGGRTNHIMQPIAKSTSYKELGAIISFLKGENMFVIEENPENNDIETKPKIQGTYLE